MTHRLSRRVTSLSLLGIVVVCGVISHCKRDLRLHKERYTLTETGESHMSKAQQDEHVCMRLTSRSMHMPYLKLLENDQGGIGKG